MKKMLHKKTEISSKSKKITVKFFTNKAVQPLIEKKIKRFPLYMLITYDRRNTMMRCHYGKYYKALNEIDKVHYPGLLTMEEKLIKKTIEYELGQQGIDFDLKGTHKKYDQYCIGIHALLERYLKDQLWNILLRLEPFEYAMALNFNDPDVSFDTLYKITRRIYKNVATLQPKNFEREIEVYNLFLKFYQGSFFQYTFPTVIEWLDNSAVDDYTNRLKSHYSSNNAMVSKSIELVDRILRHNYNEVILR